MGVRALSVLLIHLERCLGTENAFNKYLLSNLPPIGAIFFFCIELAFSKYDLPIQQAIFGAYCAEHSGG